MVDGKWRVNNDYLVVNGDGEVVGYFCPGYGVVYSYNVDNPIC